MTQPGDVILARLCQVEPIGGGETSPLLIEFCRPIHLEEDHVSASIKLSCKHFSETKELFSVDDMQAVWAMMTVALGILKSYQSKGYNIYHMTRGDLDYFDFWSGQKNPTTFGPPSAFERKRVEKLMLDPKWFVTPSQRVGIHEADLSIITYTVSPDGSDRMSHLIPRDLSRTLGRAGVAQRLGEMILSELPSADRLFED